MRDPRIISFIARSERRREILNLLRGERIGQPTIMEKTGMYKGPVSRTLKELLKQKLIICENPEDRSFKFYKISNKGKKVLEEIKNIRFPSRKQ